MSERAFSTDTRFGKAADFAAKFEKLTGENIIHTIPEAEPIGPKKLLDIMIIAPCTGNTLAKIARGVTDSCVTLATKAHLRNLRPVIIAVSTNDGLGANAENIGRLLNRKNIFFVPFSQDDPITKENSLVAEMPLILPTALEALENRQLQPILRQK
jgi:dipicolinate synthase subunit B